MNYAKCFTSNWVFSKNGVRAQIGWPFIITITIGGCFPVRVFANDYSIPQLFFSVDEISSQEAAYQLTKDAFTELWHDDQFIRDLRRGVRLMVASWGWVRTSTDRSREISSSLKDIEHKRLFSKRHKNQKWSYWPVRLYKAGKCMWLFEQDDYYESLKVYAHRIKLGKHNYNDDEENPNNKDTPEKLEFFSHTRNGKADVLEEWDRAEKL